jgi:hypothetical protein
MASAGRLPPENFRGKVISMSKIIGAAAVAMMMIAATVVWSKSTAVKPEAAALAAHTVQAESAPTVSPSDIKLTSAKRAAQADSSHAENARDSHQTSDREYSWGPFRLVDW